MKKNTSMRQALEQKSLQVAVKITIPLFILITAVLISLQVQQKMKIIGGKIDIDQEFLVDAIRIGDIFFITKYVSAFVESGSTPFCGIVNTGTGNWIAHRSADTSNRMEAKPTHSFNVSFTNIALPLRKTLTAIDGQEWQLAYTLNISFSLFLIALVASILVSTVILVLLRSMLASTSTYFTMPLQNLITDLNAQKNNEKQSLETPIYKSNHRFEETDQLVTELNSLLKEIKEQQDELKQAEVLKALNRLSRQVSHDIKSPLGALKVASANLEENKASKLILKAVDRIDKIIDDLSPSSESITETAIVSTNLGAFISDIIDEKTLEFQSSDKPEVTFIFKKPQKPITVDLNQSDFARAVSNIINNGIEAVDVKPAKIKIQIKQENDSAILAIEDNGQGISPAHLNKVTDRGFTNGKPNGSGTGLSFANEVTLALGGTLIVKSQLKKSTTIVIVIPL